MLTATVTIARCHPDRPWVRIRVDGEELIIRNPPVWAFAWVLEGDGPDGPMHVERPPILAPEN